MNNHIYIIGVIYCIIVSISPVVPNWIEYAFNYNLNGEEFIFHSKVYTFILFSANFFSTAFPNLISCSLSEKLKNNLFRKSVLYAFPLFQLIFLFISINSGFRENLYVFNHRINSYYWRFVAAACFIAPNVFLSWAWVIYFDFKTKSKVLVSDRK